LTGKRRSSEERRQRGDLGIWQHWGKKDGLDRPVLSKSSCLTRWGPSVWRQRVTKREELGDLGKKGILKVHSQNAKKLEVNKIVRMSSRNPRG